MPYTLMYTSVATVAMEDDDVAKLLSRSRERNAAEGVTGLLVYIRLDPQRGAFLQVLEGSRDTVEETYSRIERDELHERLTVLLRTSIEEVRFHQWSMKFHSLDESDLRKIVNGQSSPDAAVWLGDREAMDQLVVALTRAKRQP